MRKAEDGASNAPGRPATVLPGLSFTAQAPTAGRSSITSKFAELRVKQLEQEVTVLRASLICAINQLLDLRDLNTGVHSTRLAEWALHVARDLGMPENALA